MVKCVKKAKKIINEEYNLIESISDVAKKIEYNYHTLRCYFVRHTGLTLGNYLNKVRCHNAKHYIIHTDLKIQYIALKVGYNDEMYFCKVFKKMYGKCPSEFRK